MEFGEGLYVEISIAAKNLEGIWKIPGRFIKKLSRDPEINLEGLENKCQKLLVPNDKACCREESIRFNSELKHSYFTEQFRKASSDFLVRGTQELADMLTAARDRSGLINVK